MMRKPPSFDTTQSEVFLRRDLAAILEAISYAAAAASDPDTPHGAAYRRGFRAALAAVALAVHIPPEEVTSPGVRVRVYTVSSAALPVTTWPALSGERG
jgi:hypothetical protein